MSEFPVRVTLARSLYSIDAVRAAIAAYAGLGRFELSEGNDSFELEIGDPDPDVADTLADEFCNHALFETVNLFREAKGRS